MGKSVALLALAILVAVLAIGSMREDSATADEAAHIAAGLLKLREGRIDVYATQTPLIEALIAAPLALSGYRVPDEWRQYGNRPWVAGHMLLYRAGYDSQRILRMARLPVIALLLALCFAVWSFVREVTGNEAAAIAAFALTGFCPTLLAHGRLATVDMGVTLFMFLATMLLLRLLRAPSIGVAVATGIAVACTLASKVSGALLVPFFAIVAVLWFWERRRPDRRRHDHFHRHLPAHRALYGPHAAVSRLSQRSARGARVLRRQPAPAVPPRRVLAGRLAALLPGRHRREDAAPGARAVRACGHRVRAQAALRGPGLCCVRRALPAGLRLLQPESRHPPRAAGLPVSLRRVCHRALRRLAQDAHCRGRAGCGAGGHGADRLSVVSQLLQPADRQRAQC